MVAARATKQKPGVGLAEVDSGASFHARGLSI